MLILLLFFQKSLYLFRVLTTVCKWLCITNILNAIQSGIYTATVRDRLEALEEERTELEVKIANEKNAKPVLTEKQVEFWLTQLAKNETDSLEQKRRLIDAFLNSVFLYEDSAVITFNYKFGSKTVSLADIHNYSDLTGLGEPRNPTTKRFVGFLFFWTIFYS